jgi:D-alanyl-D-alanine carboxypeptidase
VLGVFVCGVLVWVLFGPRSLSTSMPPATASPIARLETEAVAGPSPEPLPACGVGDILTWHRQYTDWQITLLDTTYRVSSSYVPPDLVPIKQAGFSGDGEVRAFVIDDLRQLREGASSDGIVLGINSAYRSYTAQADVFAQAQASFGTALGALAAAEPGHSEHQLGTAVDFDVDPKVDTLKVNWLVANAWKFGFVSSFPLDSSPAFTCYHYEPWHYRYVGRDTAATIHNSGLTIREWIWINAPPAPGYGATPTPVWTKAPTPSPSGSPGSGPATPTATLAPIALPYPSSSPSPGASQISGD